MRPPIPFTRVCGPAGCCLFGIILLAGCGDNARVNSVSDAGPPPPASSLPPPVPAALTIDGHYRGVADNGDGSFRYYTEFLLTEDGQVRLQVNGPGDTSSIGSGIGVPANMFRSPESMQFVGNVSIDGAEAFGSGVVIDENCAGTETGRFCGTVVPASLRLTGKRAEWYTALLGELTLNVGGNEETWQLDLAEWSFYYEGASVAPDGTSRPPAGTYIEAFARFTWDGDVAIAIDETGRLFFQSAESGCVGNGALVPHADGHRYVFDVRLVIDNCNAVYAAYNREYTGLSTNTQDGAWSYDDWLIMFLSAVDDSGAPVGVTTIASYNYANRGQ